MLTWSDIITLRMERQYLAGKAGRGQYDQLYRAMSPVPTRYWTEPGSPPTLPMHADFDDYTYNHGLRAERKLLKGRFAGGTIGYVQEEDLEVFACLYRKEVTRYTELQMEILELLKQEGPMNIGFMKELTKALAKEITPQLHRLQEAFILYEDQIDNDHERGWYLLESEFPEIDLDRYSKVEALKKVLPRTAALLIFFDEELLKAYYRLPLGLVQNAISELVEEGSVLPVTLEGRSGYILKQDEDLLKGVALPVKGPSVILLQRNDFLVRAYADILKKSFSSQWDVLNYILIDGSFHGAVVGKFKFGPHVIEDVILDLSEEEKAARQEEIVEAVYEEFDRYHSPILRFNGKELPYEL